MNNKHINIFMIYIDEAHTIDEWYIGESAGTLVYKHKTIEDRIKCINIFKEKYNPIFPIYPDDMQNTFMNTFASWPVRCFITQSKKIQHISKPQNGEVDFCELFAIALKL